MTATPDHDDDEEEDFRAHLNDVKDGCGCTEIWEHMSDERES